MCEGVVIGGRLAGVVLAVALGLPAAAAAQSQDGPFAGLFGRTPPRTGQEVTRVEGRGSLGGQYDGTLADGGAQSDSNEPLDGALAGATTGVAFERRRDRLNLRGKAGATYQEFLGAERFGAPTYDGSVTMAAKVATRFTIDASASGIRSPFFQFSPAVPDMAAATVVPVPGDRFTTRAMRNDAFEGTVGITNQFTRRSSVAATLTRRETRFLEHSENNYSGWGGRGDFRRRVSRNATVRFSYGREEARQRLLGSGIYVHEVIDAGVDLDRQIALARRTSLGFYTQTSMLREKDGPRRYRLNGGVSLGRDFRRTWNMSLLVNRDTEFHPGFVAPLFSSGAALAVGGLLAPRAEWTANLVARRGQIGFDGTNPYTAYSGTTRLSAGITKHTGLYCQYTYYRYELPPDATIVDMLPRFGRQQLSVGVTLWMPIYTHVRAPRDPR